LLACGHVDNGWPARFVKQNICRERRALRGRSLHYFDGDVVAAEAVDETLRMQQAKLSGDIFLD